MAINPTADSQYKCDIRDANNVRRVRLFTTKEEALLFEADILKTLPPKGQRKRGVKPKRVTVEEFIQQVIDEEKRLLENDEAKYGTILRWESHLNLLPEWIKSKKLFRVSERDCERVLKYMKERPRYVHNSNGKSEPSNNGKTLCSNTIKLHFKWFKAMLERAVTQKLLRVNPADRVKLPKSKQGGQNSDEIEEQDRLHKHELASLLSLPTDILPVMLFVLIAVMALAGLRVGEARTLQRHDLQLDNIEGVGPEQRRRPRIYVQRTAVKGRLGRPKTWQVRYVDVVPALEAILRWWIASLPAHPQTWLFRSDTMPKAGTKQHAQIVISSRRHKIDLEQHGWCVSEGQLSKRWCKLMRKWQLGRPMQMLGLRHTFATLALEAKEELYYVSKQLGHKTTEQTEKTYAKWVNLTSRGNFAASIQSLHLPTQSVLPPASESPRLLEYAPAPSRLVVVSEESDADEASDDGISTSYVVSA